MNSIKDFMVGVKSSRKRTAVIYHSGSFAETIQQFRAEFLDILVLDCAKLYNGSLTFSATDLLNRIESETRNKPAIILNMETFIVSNSPNFSDQLARLLIVREPLKPLFFIFYSKKIYTPFRNHYESRELNRQNILEL